MKQSEFENIKCQVCTEMEYLYKALCKFPNVNSEVLQCSKKKILSSPFKNDTSKIDVSIEAITFDISTANIKHLLLRGDDDIDNVKLRLCMTGIIDANIWKDKDKNPWKTLSFKAELLILTLQGKLYSKCFHVDQIDSEETKSQEIHPVSHLHFNFNNIDSTEDSISCDVPRLVHYPIDIVLGISIALQSYAPDLYKHLKNDNYYISLCHDRQKRILKPYFENFVSAIDRKGKSNTNIKQVCPYLL